MNKKLSRKQVQSNVRLNDEDKAALQRLASSLKRSGADTARILIREARVILPALNGPLKHPTNLNASMQRKSRQPVVAARPTIQHAQTVKQARLLDMLYRTTEIAEELGVTADTIVRTWIPAGLPFEADARGHRWINGEVCSDWIQQQDVGEKTTSFPLYLNKEDQAAFRELRFSLGISQVEILRRLIHEAKHVLPKLEVLAKVHPVPGRTNAHNHFSGFLSNKDKLELEELALALNLSRSKTFRQLVREAKNFLPELQILAKAHPVSIGSPFIYANNRCHVSLNKRDNSTLKTIADSLGRPPSETIRILIREGKRAGLDLQALSKDHPASRAANSKIHTRSFIAELNDDDQAALQDMAEEMGRSRADALRILIREAQTFLPAPEVLARSRPAERIAARPSNATYRLNIDLSDEDGLTFRQIGRSLWLSTTDTARLLIQEGKKFLTVAS